MQDKCTLGGDGNRDDPVAADPHDHCCADDREVAEAVAGSEPLRDSKQSCARREPGGLRPDGLGRAPPCRNGWSPVV